MMSWNLDFVALVSQLEINVVLIIALSIYLGCTYSWEAESKQEAEAESQFN